jgi:hypothetical protein
VEFPRGGQVTRGAGFELARMAREAVPDLAILLQSSRVEFAAGAAEVGAAFLRKYSVTLLTDLRHFMVEHFAFGDFIFRMPNGREVGRASDLKTLEELLQVVPAESIAFHGERNHFSNWFTARTEFALARKLKPRKVRDFGSLEDLRHDLVASIAEYRREQSETLVADFDRHTFDPEVSFFTRIGGGSLGGKARGLAFVRFLLAYHSTMRRFSDVHITVPSAIVLATDCFDRFLADNDLLAFALSSNDDDEILRRFLRRLRAPCWRTSISFCTECGGRWRCDHPACSRTRSTCLSPGSTTPSCCRTTIPRHASAWRNWLPRSSGSTLRPSVIGSRRISGRRPTAWRRRRWPCCCRRSWARATGHAIPRTSREWRAAQLLSFTSAPIRRWHRGGGAGDGPRGRGGRAVPDVLPALPPAPGAVLRGR